MFKAKITVCTRIASESHYVCVCVCVTLVDNKRRLRKKTFNLSWVVNGFSIFNIKLMGLSIDTRQG